MHSRWHSDDPPSLLGLFRSLHIPSGAQSGTQPPSAERRLTLAAYLHYKHPKACRHSAVNQQMVGSLTRRHSSIYPHPPSPSPSPPTVSLTETLDPHPQPHQRWRNSPIPHRDEPSFHSSLRQSSVAPPLLRLSAGAEEEAEEEAEAAASSSTSCIFKRA